MIDVCAALRSMLAGNSAVNAFFTSGIELGVDAHRGYKPSDGPLLLANRRGGGTNNDYVSSLLRNSYQVQCYAATEALVREADRIVFDAMQDKQCGRLRMIRNEQLGILLLEPVTDWPVMVSFWTVWATTTP